MPGGGVSATARSRWRYCRTQPGPAGDIPGPCFPRRAGISIGCHPALHGQALPILGVPGEQSIGAALRAKSSRRSNSCRSKTSVITPPRRAYSPDCDGLVHGLPLAGHRACHLSPRAGHHRLDGRRRIMGVRHTDLPRGAHGRRAVPPEASSPSTGPLLKNFWIKRKDRALL